MHVFDMKVEEGQRSWALIYETGEGVVEQVQEFARRHEVASAHFAGLGALSSACLAYFNWTRKEYDEIPIDEQVEVTSLVGDVGVEKGRVAIHAHAVLGRPDGRAVTGHLIRGTVRPSSSSSCRRVWVPCTEGMTRKQD